MIFTLALCLIVPWFGRAALIWIVDMSAIGTALAYLFTSLTAFKYLAQNPDIPEARWGKPVCLIGAATSIICFILLVFPSSPAAISVPSWIMLFIWVGLGGLFYLNRREELLHIPHSRLRYLLFGKAIIRCCSRKLTKKSRNLPPPFNTDFRKHFTTRRRLCG